MMAILLTEFSKLKPEEVQLHWKDAEGKDYQSLTRLKNALEA